MQQVLPISTDATLGSAEEPQPHSHVRTPDAPRQIPSQTPIDRRKRQALLATVLVVLGSATLLPLWVSVTRMWATDPLRSIGAVFPAIALLGVLSCWRTLLWEQNGTLWGLSIVLASIPLSRLVSVSNLDVNVDGGVWGLLHLGPALFLYALGATLLFGGPRLLRAAIAPLCLLLAINPIPHAFNALADMPLQRLSAETARAFAHLIGLQPTGEQLRMMFAPNFGMLIVPGCNGVRGAVTLAYLTLIFAYTRRLRGWLLVGVSVAALLAGYALNLLRLCLLVVYYRIGLALPSIQKHGEGVDYAIGCTLFLLATVAIGVGIRALEPSVKPLPSPPAAGRARRSGFTLRALSFAAVALVFILPQLHAFATLHALQPDEAHLLHLLPAQAGPWRLEGTHAEHNSSGMVVLGLGEYVAPPIAPGEPDRRLTFGLWVGGGDHLVALSKLVQGAQAEWTGSFEASGPHHEPIHLVNALYNDGVTASLDAETTCTSTVCSAHLAGNGRHGFLFIGPRVKDLFFPPTTLRLPLVFERIWPAGDGLSDQQRTQFEQDARQFIQQLDLPTLVQQAGSRP